MSGYTQLTQIAGLLDRDKSTISLELRRNWALKGYRPLQAHNMALRRCYDKVQPRIGSKVGLVKALARDEWSLEQVVGRVEIEQGVSIRHEWIYQYVYSDKRSGGDLNCFLRCQKVPQTLWRL